MKFKYLILPVLVFAVWACKKDKPETELPIPPNPNPDEVVFDINEVPYTYLSQYNFFQGPIAELNPVSGVLPYDVITPLFSDYASKKRFVWMPAGVSASYAGDDKSLDFADGGVLIKNFYYNNVQPSGNKRILETRIMFRKNGFWQFANYVWNDEQTEAVLDLQGSNVPLTWIDENEVTRDVVYRIPNVLECQTCHKSFSTTVALGVKPQHLNKTYNYADGAANQLMKWQQMGYLSGTIPNNIQTTVPWNDPSEDLTARVRSYLDMNCSHCHMEGGHCDYRPMRFNFAATTDPANIGVCVEPEEDLGPPYSHIISAGNVDKSVIHLRLSSTDQTVRMPLLGRTVVHEEAVEMMIEYINSLQTPCN